MTSQTSSQSSAAKRPRRMAREPMPQVTHAPAAEQVASTGTADTSLSASPDKGPTKIGIVLALLTRPEGATIEQMTEATGWLPHTTRAALTGLKKKEHEVSSVKAGGVRTYRVVGQAAQEPAPGTTASEPQG